MGVMRIAVRGEDWRNGYGKEKKKDEREIELMRHAGMLVSKMHKYLKPFIKEGITTKELDRLAEEFIVKK